MSDGKPRSAFRLAAIKNALTLFVGAISFSATVAFAKVNVASDMHGYYDACIAKFTAAGMRDLVDELDKSGYVVVVRNSAGTISNPDDKDAAQDGRGTGGKMRWNPTDTSPFPGEYGVNHDPCATLYHEMRHQVDYIRGTNDDRMCGTSGITRKEVEATLAENRYRRKVGLPERTLYEPGTTLPPDDGSCKTESTKSPPRSGCNAAGAGCAASNGDVHMTTFDQRNYDFHAVGEFVLVRSTSDPAFEIQARQAPLPFTTDVSVNSAVAMKVAGRRVGFYMKDSGVELKVDGVITDLQATAVDLGSGGSVLRQDDGEISLQWPDGSEALIFEIGTYGLRLRISPAQIHSGKLEGLLGNFDGSGENDLAVAGSRRQITDSFQDLYSAFDDSWRVTPDSSLFDYDHGKTTKDYTDLAFPKNPIDIAQLENRDAAEAQCRASGTTDPNLLNDCILDVAVTGIADFASNTSQLEKQKRSVPSELILSGDEIGRLVATSVTCAVFDSEQQFSMAVLGMLNGRPIELHVNVLNAYRGAGSYSVGSVIEQAASATVSTSVASYASSADSNGTFRVLDPGFSGTMNIALAAPERELAVSGRWVCEATQYL